MISKLAERPSPIWGISYDLLMGLAINNAAQPFISLATIKCIIVIHASVPLFGVTPKPATSINLLRLSALTAETKTVHNGTQAMR